MRISHEESGYRQHPINVFEDKAKFTDVFKNSYDISEYIIENNIIQELFYKIQADPYSIHKRELVHQFIYIMYQLCSSICLENTPSLIRKLEESQLLSERELSWIIPNKVINETLDEIEKNKSFVINRPAIVTLIEIYLSTQLFVSIIDRFRNKFNLSPAVNKYTILVQNLKTRRKRKYKLDEIDFAMHDLFQYANPIFQMLKHDENYNLMTFLENAKSRNLNNILLPIYFDCCFERYNTNESEIKKKEKLILLYPLFALIMKNKDWKIDKFLHGKKKGEIDYRTISLRLRKFLFKD